MFVCVAQVAFFDNTLESILEMFEFVMTENEGVCIFGLPKLGSLSPSRRTIKGARRTNGTWNHHLCYTGCNARYLSFFIYPLLSVSALGFSSFFHAFDRLKANFGI